MFRLTILFFFFLEKINLFFCNITFKKAFESYFLNYHKKFPFKYEDFEFVDYHNGEKLINDYQFRLKYLWKDAFSLNFPFPQIMVYPRFGNIFYKIGSGNSTGHIILFTFSLLY